MTNFLQVVGFDPLLIENTTPSTTPGPPGPPGPSGPAGGVNTVDGQSGNVSLTDTYVPPGANIQSTVRKLADVGAVGDVNILVLGDSTAAQAGQWPDQLLPLVQSLYPHRTLQKATWDNVGKAYGALGQVGPTGTGATFINFYQGAVSGTVFESFLGAQWEAQVGAIQPDLVIVHSGINYGYSAANGGFASNAVMDYTYLERFTRFVLQIKDTCPSADIMVNGQNPYLVAGARDSVSTVRAQAARVIAARYGCAYGPITEAFLATGNPTAYIQGDLTHPTTSGATNGALLGANALLPQFKGQPNMQVSPRIPSSLQVPGRQLLTNADFSNAGGVAWDGGNTTLTGWTVSNANLSKDATNFESKNGYAVKVTGTATANCEIYQGLSASSLKQVKGRVITVAARCYVPSGASSQCGRLQISGDGVTVTATGTLTNLQGVYAWIFATVRIPASCTFVTIALIGGTALSDTSSFDRVSCVVGESPRDIA